MPDENTDHMAQQIRDVEGLRVTPELFLTNIAGIPHRKPDLTKLSVGDLLLLVPEPDNRFDPNAIKVMHGDTHLGYIPRLDNCRPEVKGQNSAHIVSIQPVKWQEVTISIP